MGFNIVSGGVPDNFPQPPGEYPWLLPSNHVVSSIYGPQIVYPRPDNETNTWARHRLLMNNMEARIPIGVNFGTFPLHFEITDGPVEATIGQDLTQSGDVLVPGDDYGVIVWTPDSLGAYSFTVRVTDQDLRFADITFTGYVRDNSGSQKYFVFIDPINGSDSNSGYAENDAWQTNYPIHLDSISTSTYSGMHVFLMGDEANPVNMIGISGISNHLRFTGTDQPLVWLAHPDYPEATLNMANCWNMTFNGGNNDVFLGGFRIGGNDPNTADNKSIVFFNGSSRMTFFDLENKNFNAGPDNGDNGGFIYMSGLRRDYFFMSRILHTGNIGATGSLYGIRNFVIEYVRIASAVYASHDGSSEHGTPYLKGKPLIGSVRCCHAEPVAKLGAYHLGTFTLIATNNPSDTTDIHDVEISYCSAASSLSDYLGGGYGYSGTYSYTNIRWIRNSVHGVMGWDSSINNYPPVELCQGNIFYSPYGDGFLFDTYGAAINPSSRTLVDNLTGDTDASILDADTAEILSAYRSQYLGLYGAEIA